MGIIQLRSNLKMATETKRKRTKICCLDLDKELVDWLNISFDTYNGSLGNPINVNKFNSDGLKLLLNYNLPENIQEYEVFIEDMVKKEPIQYKEEEHTRTNILGQSAYYFFSYPPQTIFDPCPYSCKILQSRIKNQRPRPAIKIAFQNQYIEVDYIIRDAIDSYDSSNYKANNYMHLPNFCSSHVTGREVMLCDNSLSRSIFEPFLDDITYNEIYVHPMSWGDGNYNEKDERFLPLLMTHSGSVISYIWISDNDITIILPQTCKKKELLNKVFQEILFRHFSDYFPEITESAWINNPLCYLPNYQNLLNEKEELEKKYKKELEIIEHKIESNYNKYGFLHDILTSTGNELVAAMIKYFRWLGFPNVVDKDKNLDKDFYEEDLQIETDVHGLLIVEVKGIYGTSTDAQCAQILKVVNRRREERKSFGVFGLYIVNNERGITPERRHNPPFNQQQILDAEYDKRGLCYTWRLFNLFFEIEEGVISKDEARKAFFNKGLIDFKPQVIEIGVPHDYYKQHQVACIVIGEQVINLGDFFYYMDGIRWRRVKIVSIRHNEGNVESATNGSYGFGLEHRIPNGKTLYILRSSKEPNDTKQ